MGSSTAPGGKGSRRGCPPRQPSKGNLQNQDIQTQHLQENKFPTGLKQPLFESDGHTGQHIGDGTWGAQSTSPALGHGRDLVAEDLHRCSLLRASPTVEVTLYQPLSNTASDATSHQGQEAAYSCAKDPKGIPCSLCQQSAFIECLEARAPSRIRPEPTSPCRRKWHQLHKADAEAEVQHSPGPAAPAGHKVPAECHDGAQLLCSTRVDMSRDT